MRRRICPRPRNDLRHHGSVRHAQTQNAVHPKLWIDNSKLVHAHFARTNCVTETCRGQSGKFLDLLGPRLGPWNEFALAQTVGGMLIFDFTRALDGAHDGRKIVIRAEIVAIDQGGILKVVASLATFRRKNEA